jgi:hypothetical protein
MLPVWQDFFDHMPSMPTSHTPDAVLLSGYSGPELLVNALKPAVKADRTPNAWLPDPNSLSICYFDLCKVETTNAKRLSLAQATFDELVHRYLGPGSAVGGLSALPVAAASLGRSDLVATLIHQQMEALPAERSAAYKKGGLLANRLSSAKGTQGLSAQHLGRASEALQQALLQSNPPEPGQQSCAPSLSRMAEGLGSTLHTLRARRFPCLLDDQPGKHRRPHHRISPRHDLPCAQSI